MYGTKNISGSSNVPNHRSPHVLTHFPRMARFYDGWLSYSPNSLYRDRAHPIAFIQAYIEPYRQGLQDILIVSTIKTTNLIEGGIMLFSVIPPFFCINSLCDAY